MVVVSEYSASHANILAHKIPNSSNYQGVLYDIWKLVREKLQHKYTFIEHFIKSNNYDKMTVDVSTGIYDMVVGPFTITLDRLKIINFTNNIIVNKHTILHLPRVSMSRTIKIIIKKVIIGPLVIAICIGIILGAILHLFEPTRYVKARVIEKFALRRTITTVIASLFGEAGFLSENSTMSISGIIIVFFILIFAFFFVMLLQAVVTDRVIDLKSDSAYNIHNIKGTILLCPTGYASGIFMKRYGATIEYHDDTITNIIKLYLQNPTKYAGISLDMFNSVSHESSEFNLVSSNSDFGYSEVCWVVSKKHQQLIKDINMTLVPIQFNLRPYYICKKYLNKEQVYLCNL